MNIVTKSYESLLPFLVVEAISSQTMAFNAMSVMISENGWAWLISGRKLLIWKFRDSKSSTMAKARRTLSPCFELQLPQSDLTHKAELVNVFFMPQNPNTSIRAITVPAAISVSPEGQIRFWSNIANERYAESTIQDLQGREFCTLVPISSLEYLLGTTTGSVFLVAIHVNSSDPKGVIVCSALAEPAGILTGFSRRMTNLFFGPMTTTEANSDSRRPLIAVPKYSQSTIDKTNSTDRPFFVLSSIMKLRQWARTNEGVNSLNQIIREWDLQNNLNSMLRTQLRVPESRSLSYWPVDMITTKSKELLILLVVLDSSRNNSIYYATCLFNPYQAGDNIANVTIMKSHSWNYTNESEEQILSLRFLDRRANSSLSFIFDRKFLFLAQTDSDILDAVDFANQDDGILGAGYVDGQAILFTQRDGLICVLPVVSNKSRIDDCNETSIQIEAHMASHVANASRVKSDAHQSQPVIAERAEPMLVEIDEGPEEQENSRPRRQNLSRQRIDQSTTNKSALDASNVSKASDRSVSRTKEDEVNDILKDNKELEWVLLIDKKKYDQAGDVLYKLATENEALKDRKETLLALSKIAKLAE